MIHGAVIMRTTIDLPAEQIQALARLCQSEKISRAEAVRRALEEMLARKSLAGREAAFGAWRPRGDSRAVVEGWRREWER